MTAFFHNREREVDGVKESIDRVGVIGGQRIPVDDEREINPAVIEEHAAGNRPRVKSGNIGVAAFCIGAYAQRQGHEINEIAQAENAAEFVQSLLARQSIE